MDAKRIVAFGEILLRFTPQDDKPIAEATGFDCFYGGSEANVAIGLAALGDKVSYITVLPDNELGLAAKDNLIKYGVNTNNILIDGSVLGSYFIQKETDGVSAAVIYNRKGSEISKASVNTPFDYDEIFKDCGVFHISGISFALSESCRELCFKFVNEAKKRGVLVSFDFNYRPRLWSADEAKPVFQKIISLADIVFCGKMDLDTFFDEKTPEKVIEEYGCKYLVYRNRPEGKSGERMVSALIYEKLESSIKRSIKITTGFKGDHRIGTGDAFDAGFIHALCKDSSNLNEIIDFAVATFIVKHSVPGDFLAVSEEELGELFVKSQK
ncbi:MAG: sugar kinase [Lachnospiraceae bacterium]|nr:sugar kinase [Lachnospiraceae bacterium]